MVAVATVRWFIWNFYVLVHVVFVVITTVVVVIEVECCDAGLLVVRGLQV